MCLNVNLMFMLMNIYSISQSRKLTLDILNWVVTLSIHTHTHTHTHMHAHSHTCTHTHTHTAYSQTLTYTHACTHMVLFVMTQEVQLTCFHIRTAFVVCIFSQASILCCFCEPICWNCTLLGWGKCCSSALTHFNLTGELEGKKGEQFHLGQSQ